MKIFKDIEIGNIVIVYDEYLHDYIEHKIKIDSIEYDKSNYGTETNPSGMYCYGTDLDYDEDEDEYISLVHEGNFICFAEDDERLEIL